MIFAAKVDAEISHSLISSSRVRETGYQPDTCPVVSVRDSVGVEYKARSYVTLRWRRGEASRTQATDFYIVDEVVPDVMFAKSAVQDRPRTNTHVLEHQPRNPGMYVGF